MGSIDLRTGPDLPPKTDYGIGCIGAGFIMKDIHLVAYGEAGFNVVALASRTPAFNGALAPARGLCLRRVALGRRAGEIDGDR